jgi:hypothetical protein
MSIESRERAIAVVRASKHAIMFKGTLWDWPVKHDTGIRLATVRQCVELGLLRWNANGGVDLVPSEKIRLVYDVPAHMVDKVNQAVAGVLENDNHRHHE